MAIILNNVVHAIKMQEFAEYDEMGHLLDNLNLNREIKKIAIKINMCDFRLRETGATSDPKIVGKLLGALRKRYPSSEIFLMENDATSALADILFEYLGINEVAQKHGANTVNLAHEKWVEKKIDGLIFHRVEVPEFLKLCDLLITFPKLKTHGTTKITCGLKNMFGCLRNKRKIKFHKFLDEAIVDANLAFRPHLSIVDADICQEGIGGPIYGTPRRLGLLIAGADVVAVDSFCSKLIGFNPWFVGHIRKAAQKNLGIMTYHLKTNLSSDELKRCKFDFSRSEYYLSKLLRKLR